jgi:nitrogen fixation-related uncharacterized protein
MLQRSPLPVRHANPVITTDPTSLFDSKPFTSDPICGKPIINISSSTDKKYYQSCCNKNISSDFLIICVALLLILIALVGFAGYWAINSNNHNNKCNKRKEKFLTNFLYGFGILSAIVIFFLFYLIIR